MAENIIELKNITKTFDDQQVLKGIDLNIKDKEFLTLLGPSGCGKTTILRIISGFEDATEGQVIFEGVDISKIPSYKREVNTVFQKYALFPFLNVYDNVAFGLNIKKIDKSIIEEKVVKMLELVGLKGYERRDVSSLSGGQQQRVAVVRGVINNPQVLFADEPTGALNSQNTQNVLNILTGLNEDGQSIVMVTHTLMAAERGNRIIYLSDGVISDEVDLGPYLGDYKDESNPNHEAAVARHTKLKTFLQNMGW